MAKTEKIYSLWLNSIEGIGAKRFYEICAYLGSPEEVYRHASREDLLRIPFLGEKLASAIMEAKNESVLDAIETSISVHGASIFLRNDPEYPAILREISDPPPVLYVKGNVDFNALRMIAMVGTRRPTRYGRDVAYRIAQELADEGITIVSGLARGIDACCHAGALAGGGNTVAVLGCGVNIVYPSENHRLYDEITERGAVVSDYHFDTPPLGNHFPARNRIISGLSRGTVVVESKEKGGSLITATFALEQNRDVFAVPGNITSQSSVGTNGLVSEGAKMVLGAHSILEEYPDWRSGGLVSAMIQQAPDLSGLQPDELQIVRLLMEGELTFDALSQQTGLQAGSLGAALTILEIKGIIKQLPGRIYCIC